MIFSCYPDYGKAPPEYIVNVIDVLATFPEWVLVKLCDLRTGIPARCNFLPTVADVVKAGDRIILEENLRVEQEKALAAAEVLRLAAEAEHKKRAAWWKTREAALVKAKVKYPNAFLAADGSLMQPRD